MFNPNQSTLASCIENILSMQKEAGINSREIVHSRQPKIRKLMYKALAVDNVPKGFTKTLLPVYFESASTMYISSGAPYTKVPKHSHDEGAGIRFMISGSIHFGDVELTQGDWMYIPAGAGYEFEVGPQGATMCYCYQCSCA
ncbi:cupin domain-containing protein [Arenicella xantha]|uniref:Cupin domain n=1 Tax=Arenicella xantha TaxID=644221 RepID=A0A395JMB8_9GAMM|nr:cupin domain-containing protein [Arenicella xantha]RBP50754.1 hypothetical protein DFR28_102166 [Arenicella xantha]